MDEIPSKLFNTDLSQLSIVELRKLQQSITHYIQRLEQAREALHQSTAEAAQRGTLGNQHDDVYASSFSQSLTLDDPAGGMEDQQQYLNAMELLLAKLHTQRNFAAREESLRRAMKHDEVSEKQAAKEESLAQRTESTQQQHLKNAAAYKKELALEFQDKNMKHEAKVKHIKELKEREFNKKFMESEKKLKLADKRQEQRKRHQEQVKQERYQSYQKKQRAIEMRIEEHHRKKEEDIMKKYTPLQHAMLDPIMSSGGNEAFKSQRLAAQKELNKINSVTVTQLQKEASAAQQPLRTEASMLQPMGKSVIGRSSPPPQTVAGGGAAVARAKSSMGFAGGPKDNTTNTISGVAPKKSNTPPPGTTSTAFARLTKPPAPRGMELGKKLAKEEEERDRGLKEYKDAVAAETAVKNAKRSQAWETNNERLQREKEQKFKEHERKKRAEAKRMQGLRLAQEATIATISAQRSEKINRVLCQSAALNQSSQHTTMDGLPTVDRWGQRGKMIIASVCSDLLKASAAGSGSGAMKEARKPAHGFEHR